MKVKVKLFATLRDGRFEEDVLQFEPQTTVAQVVAALNILDTEVKVAFVNNRHAKLDHELHDGDVLGIFPPIGGG